MTNLYLDTEFNGHGGELISIALVSSCGKEFYEVLPFQTWVNPWVQQNVFPKLGKMPTSRGEVLVRLDIFLSQFDSVTVIADWCSDFKHFFGLFEGPDFSTSLDRPVTAVLKSGPSDIRPENPHNALSDARALRDYWEARAA